MVFSPIELRKIREKLYKSEFLKHAKSMMRPVERFYTALHQCSKVSYSRHDLLNLGIQGLGTEELEIFGQLETYSRAQCPERRGVLVRFWLSEIDMILPHTHFLDWSIIF